VIEQRHAGALIRQDIGDGKTDPAGASRYHGRPVGDREKLV